MIFGDKLKKTRLAADISQAELASKTGISERSIYSYEQLGILPRLSNVQKLATALGVTPSYLLGKTETDGADGGNVKTKEILDKVSALFSGGELEDEEKDDFFKTITEVYLDSKNGEKRKRSTKK